jgi:tricorn protease
MEVLNGQIIYGIPQLGSRDFETGWFENQEVVPDELVYNDPDSIEDGRDPQLEAAVRRVMSGLAK